MDDSGKTGTPDSRLADALMSNLIAPVRALFVSDAKEGLLLIVVALAAIAAANSALAEPYHALFHKALAWSPIAKLATLHLWINDAVMAVFFFVVGLEVKRELVEGGLSDPAARRLPVIAAIAGMAVPAFIFVAVVSDDGTLDRGWAIPAATDIAFAMGLVGLLGSRVPPRLRLFLLTVAIVDDIGAVLVIAVFYTVQVKALWMLGAVAVAALMGVMNLRRVDRLWPYVLAGVMLWMCVLNSGIHATVAGVIAALTIPMRTREDKPLLVRAEHALAPWNAYLVVPLFAFANAGVDLRGLGPGSLLSPLPLAIAAGLFAGKQLGIMGALAGSKWLGIAQPPEGASWLQLWGISMLCGIGFTMSLFIGTMAFADDSALYEQVKLGVLGGTLLSLMGGYIVLRLSPVTTAGRGQ